MRAFAWIVPTAFLRLVSERTFSARLFWSARYETAWLTIRLLGDSCVRRALRYYIDLLNWDRLCVRISRLVPLAVRIIIKSVILLKSLIVVNKTGILRRALVIISKSIRLRRLVNKSVILRLIIKTIRLRCLLIRVDPLILILIPFPRRLIAIRLCRVRNRVGLIIFAPLSSFQLNFKWFITDNTFLCVGGARARNGSAVSVVHRYFASSASNV